MRLAEPIETTGMFWLPERPETGLSGVLRISETSEITVEFAGVIGNPPSVFSRVGARATPRSGDGDSDLERIVGTVEKGGRITLDGCFRQSSNMVLPSGLFRSTFYASLAFLGVEYGKKEQASFSEFSFSVDGLDAWLSISGIGEWGRMAIVDTKPFKLRVILHRIFVERPQVTGIPAWPGGAACYRRSRYIL